MNGMKGKLLKKIKSIKPVGYLALENRVLQLTDLNVNFILNSQNKNNNNNNNNNNSNTETFELIKNLDKEHNQQQEQELEEEEEEEEEKSNKENNHPGSTTTIKKKKNRDSFRKPDLNSYSLFDPNLLTAFHNAVSEAFNNSSKEKGEEEEIKFEEKADPLSDFPPKCPPGGSEGVILYTTTLRGIRSTFEACCNVRFLLESLRVEYTERDVSMHLEYREEMRRVLGDRTAVPPRLFVRGRYLGGAHEVLGLHERGRLGPLFRGVAVKASHGPCRGCGGVRFVICECCCGSRKVRFEDGYDVCLDCNENGLILCPLCC